MNPRPSGTRSRVKRTQRPTLWRWLGVLGQRKVSPATLVMIVVGGLFLFNFINQVVRQSQLENRALQQSVQYYESNDYAEIIAREQLGYARDGDTVILPTFPDQVISNTAIMTQTTVISDTLKTSDTEPNWVRWWRMLSGNP
jgi:hypothetical protein